jgi:peptidoglycan/xylan/chitin deacetylase (PgdA/CDA1 family)
MLTPRWPLTLLSPEGARARLVVLTYHRVLESPDALVDEPDAATFERQMTHVARYCNVLPLAEAHARLRAGTLPPRACCITFDDGYANNLTVAAPILRRLGLPATIFVAVEAVERGIMWNDLVIEALRRLEPARARAALATLGVQAPPQPDGTLALSSVLEGLKYLPVGDRWDAAVRLYRDAAGAEPPRQMLTPAQVRECADAGLEIGAHTVSHAILATLPENDARREIEQSRDWVRQTTGRPARCFAYPNGRPDVDFGAAHAAMVREAGFEVAVSTRRACVTQASDSYSLPRIALWDRTRLRVWLRLLREYAGSYRAASQASSIARSQIA